MAIRIDNGSIKYPYPIIPATGPWVMMLRMSLVIPVGSNINFMLFTNEAKTKDLFIGYEYQTSSTVYYYLQYNEIGKATIFMSFGGIITTSYLGILQYIPRVDPDNFLEPNHLVFWDYLGNSKTLDFMGDCSGFDSCTIMCDIGTMHVEDLTVWSGGWTFQESIIGQYCPPYMIKSRFRDILFYERYWSTLNNPYRTNRTFPTYTNVVTQDILGGQQEFTMIWTGDYAHNLVTPPGPPVETTIDIVTEFIMTFESPEKTAKLKDELTFKTSVRQNMHYVNCKNTVKFTEQITNQTRTKSFHHTLFFVEVWNKENDLQVAGDTFGDRLRIAEEITHSLNGTRPGSNSVTFSLDLRVYKQSNAENFGD